MNGTERLFMSLRPTVHEGIVPSYKQERDMNNEMLNSETRELSIGELDAVTGGAGVVDTIIQVVKKVAQLITGTTGVCTNHWYSD
jgi:hypothetical protein